MQLRSPFAKAILLLIALAAPCLWAQDGLWGALSNSKNASGQLRSSFGSRLIAADFDHDQEPDGALLLDAGVIGDQKIYRIELHLSAGENRDLVFAANDPALTISAQDVNQDGIPDLIVEQAFTHKRIQVWLNDGHGKFRQVRVEDFPAASDAPCRWRVPKPVQACLILGLPSRFESHHAAQLLEILRFDSSSSHWRVRREERSLNDIISTSDSPRAPPVSLPL
ncbi:MAG: VCBS repeat-containing protein [Terracidiphilus sp.]